MDLSTILSAIPGGSGTLAAAGTIVTDLIMRAVPTAKPLSILHTVYYFLNGGGLIALKVASFLDGIFGQKLSKPGNPPAA